MDAAGESAVTCRFVVFVVGRVREVRVFCFHNNNKPVRSECGREGMCALSFSYCSDIFGATTALTAWNTCLDIVFHSTDREVSLSLLFIARL